MNLTDSGAKAGNIVIRKQDSSQAKKSNPGASYPNVNKETDLHTSNILTESASEDEEDRLRRNPAYLQNQRPSFSIGGSDSDSTITTSNSVEYQPTLRSHLLHPHNANIHENAFSSNTPTSTVTGINTGPTGQRLGTFSRSTNELIRPKPGFISGGASATRTLATSPTPDASLRRNVRNDDVGGGPSNEDDEEVKIQLISVSGETTGFSKRQWLTFGVFGFVEFFCAMVISLQAPFYPAEVIWDT
jgi:hypothetical protein